MEIIEDERFFKTFADELEAIGSQEHCKTVSVKECDLNCKIALFKILKIMIYVVFF